MSPRELDRLDPQILSQRRLVLPILTDQRLAADSEPTPSAAARR